MNFVYETKSNIEVGEKLYGIVEGSIYTYDGVYEIVVNEIDYNRKIVVSILISLANRLRAISMKWNIMFLKQKMKQKQLLRR